MRTVIVMNVRATTTDLLELPLARQYPLSVWLEYVCVYRSYMGANGAHFDANSHLYNHLDIKHQGKPFPRLSGATNYAVDENEMDYLMFLDTLMATTKLMSNKLYTLIDVGLGMANVTDWTLMRSLSYSPENGTWVMEVI